MKTVSVYSLTAALCLFCVLFGAGMTSAGEDEFKDVREIRSVETYVPYEEFLKIAGKDPSATVMTLAEYRNLVDLAAAHNGPAKAAPLPPIETSLIEATYAGQAGDFSVRFDVQFKLSVAGKEWTRCNLGEIQNLGHVMLDGQPGWVVIENGHAQMLLRGAGLHTGTLSFAVPLQNEDDVQKVSSYMLNAASGSVRMSVPGLAIPSSSYGALDSTYDATADSTAFVYPLTRANTGTPPFFALSWKRKYDSKKSEVLLQADHHVSYLLSTASPYFFWQSRVVIGRRKTSELVFAEPPGCRVIRLAGAGVHSWVRDGSVLRVLLDAPTIGDVSIVASGVLDAPKADFELGAPELKDARKNTRTLALFEPTETALSIVSNLGLRELSLDEKPSIANFQFPRWEGRLARQFFVEQPGAKLGVRVTPRNAVFDTRTAALLSIDEKSIRLRCAIAVQPERGRVFSMALSVPPQWRLTGIIERGTGRGITLEPAAEGKEDNWTVRLNDSAGVATPFEFALGFELRDASWAEGAWDKHALNFSLPSIDGARRTERYLGITAHPSIDIAFGDMPEWRSDFTGALARVGVAEKLLRAGLASEAAGGELKLEISRPAPRGEYESVLHVQTNEHETWVRADLRILALERARAVDELVLELPADAKDPIYIAGLHVREIAPGAKANQRIVRFDQPWREVRMLRVEYRTPLASDTDTPIPDIRIDGNFDSRRRIVFQSAGVVSLDVKPGESLQTASLDDTPPFATPFKSGRALFAFTVAPGGKLGTFRTTNLESAPVLSNLVSELNLVTVLDESGIARTHADMILRYSRQYMEARLPDGAKLIALSVDGDSARPVQGGAAGAIRIPLPPASTARVEIVYEQDFGALGAFGTIEEIAPEFSEFPVNATRWNVCYPAHIHFNIAGGNTTPLYPREPRFFASAFYGRIVSGNWPEWSAWSPEKPEETVAFDRQRTGQRSHRQGGDTTGTQSQALQAIEMAAARPPAKDRAIGGLVIPEGASLKSGKLGGSARVVLSYRSIGFSAFASRAVFLIALLLGVWLLRRSMRAALIYLVAGLVLGSLIPIALNWESPLLMIPFCEGLCAFALLLGAVQLVRLVKWLFETRTERLVARTGCLAICIVAAAFTSGKTANASESEPVLIPYAKGSELPLTSNPKDTKVYVPKAVFIDLMSRVKPEKKDAAVDAPTDPGAPLLPNGKKPIVPFSLGNAEYELTADETAYTIKGTLDVTTYDPKGWAKLPLAFGPSRLVSMTIDGQPAGVSNQGGMLFVQLNGAKKFALAFELKGQLVRDAGRTSLSGQVVPGGATRLTAVVPSNVELDVRSLPPGAWIAKTIPGGPPAGEAKVKRCEIALGSTGTFALSWHSAEIRSKGDARISARSYMQFELGLDGYAVTRVERVSAAGVPVDQLVFQVAGDWDIAAVAAPGLSEWTVSGEGAEKRLRLWFQKPISEVTVQLAGWAPLGAASAPAAGLSLENALRKEGFIGLKHGEGRHFAANSFDGLKRASQEELATMVALPGNAQPDRILHYNDSPGAAQVQAEAEPARTTIETQFAAVILGERLTIGARTRYTVLGIGALRHEVELPANWTVRTVRAVPAGIMRDWEIVSNGATQRLVIYFNGRADSKTEIRWSAEAPLVVPAQGALRLELPQPRTLADAKTSETIDWIIGADGSISLSPGAETTMQPVSVERAPRWVTLDAGQEWRLAFRSSKVDTKLAVDVSRQDSALYATVVSFVSAADEHVQIASRIRYQIERAGRDKFLITLPPGAELTGLDAKNLRGRTLTRVPNGNGATLLTVLMQSPVGGEQIVDLVYRLPRTPGTDALAAPPSIEDAGRRGVEHYAGLLPSENGAVALAGGTRLNRIKDAEELPFVPANISKKALADVFAAEPGWTMTLRELSLKMETGPAAEVVTAELETTIASDGGVRSEAHYRVRNHALQFLEIAMPDDANLWSVTIGGRGASVSKRTLNGSSILSIPLPRMTETDLPVRISIVYESARIPLPALYTSYTPKAPRVLLDVPVVETHWRIYTPEDYEVGDSGGNMKPVLSSVRDSSRVNASQKEIERLTKIADAPDQRPAIRQRARQSMAVEQQELNDNVTALNDSNAAPAATEANRMSRDELQQQMTGNTTSLRLGIEWQGRLNEQKRKKELEEANTGNLDPEQIREYSDRFNFLNINWRAGALSKKDTTAPGAPAPSMRLDDLRFPRRFVGFGKVDGGGQAPTSAPKLDQTAVPPGGILENDATLTALSDGAGGLHSATYRVAELRMTQLDYRTIEEHPALTLSLRSKSATRNWSAGIALLVFAAGSVVVWRRGRKSVKR